MYTRACKRCLNHVVMINQSFVERGSSFERNPRRSCYFNRKVTYDAENKISSLVYLRKYQPRFVIKYSRVSYCDDTYYFGKTRPSLLPHHRTYIYIHIVTIVRSRRRERHTHCWLAETPIPCATCPGPRALPWRPASSVASPGS